MEAFEPIAANQTHHALPSDGNNEKKDHYLLGGGSFPATLKSDLPGFQDGTDPAGGNDHRPVFAVDLVED